jgi:hypothetical protein
MAMEGTLWFSNFLLPDTYMILAVTTVLMNLINLEVSKRGIEASRKGEVKGVWTLCYIMHSPAMFIMHPGQRICVRGQIHSRQYDSNRAIIIYAPSGITVACM